MEVNDTTLAKVAGMCFSPSGNQLFYLREHGSVSGRYVCQVNLGMPYTLGTSMSVAYAYLYSPDLVTAYFCDSLQIHSDGDVFYTLESHSNYLTTLYQVYSPGFDSSIYAANYSEFTDLISGIDMNIRFNSCLHYFLEYNSLTSIS